MNQEDVSQEEVSAVEETPVEHVGLTPELMKSIGVFSALKARRLFFSWVNPETEETHNLSFFYKELTFGGIERLKSANKLGDVKFISDILSECLYVDVHCKRKLFTAAQIQNDLHPSFVSQIIVAVEKAQKKTS